MNIWKACQFLLMNDNIGTNCVMKNWMFRQIWYTFVLLFPDFIWFWVYGSRENTPGAGGGLLQRHHQPVSDITTGHYTVWSLVVVVFCVWRDVIIYEINKIWNSQNVWDWAQLWKFSNVCILRTCHMDAALFKIDLWSLKHHMR